MNDGVCELAEKSGRLIRFALLPRLLPSGDPDYLALVREFLSNPGFQDMTSALARGLGLRVLTPVAPIQVNIGYNPYPRPNGPIYFEDPTRVQSAIRPDISPLYCVSPNNQIDLELRDGVLQPPGGSGCPASYHPPERKTWYRRLVLTFSIGPDF